MTLFYHSKKSRYAASSGRRGPVGHLDSSPRAPSDPTGTTPIIKSLNKSFGSAWQEVKKEVRKVIGEADSFGLSQGAGSIPALSASGGQVHAFQTWLESSQFLVLGGQRGALEKGVGYGYAKGVSDAQARAGKTLLEPLPGSSVILEAAVLDLYGISQAVLQQATRMFSDALLKKTRPLKLARNLALLVDKVGVQRSMQLAHYAVVRAHATGTLDALQALQINMVGVIPERVLVRDVHDHAHDTGFNPNEPRDPQGKWTSGGAWPDDPVPGEAPIGVFRRLASKITSTLPPPHPGHTRLWRGNRLKEENASSYTNSLEGIALPFRRFYGGDLTYVDVPTHLLSSFENRVGTAAGSEFNLPPWLVAKAKVVHPHHIHDAVELGKVSLRVPPLFKKPKPSEISRAFSVEKRLERMGNLVNVLNAEGACPICVAIAEDGPYTIDRARGLIPAHPNCKCAFVPA